MVVYIPMRVYIYGEFLYHILARKAIAEELQFLMPYDLQRASVVVPLIRLKKIFSLSEYPKIINTPVSKYNHGKFFNYISPQSPIELECLIKWLMVFLG